MPARRTRSLSTKVTDDEFARLRTLAGTQSLSAWAHDVLVDTMTSHPGEHLLLAEVLALRTIVVNLHVTLAAGEALTADAVHQLITRADRDKWTKANERLAAAARRPR